MNQKQTSLLDAYKAAQNQETLLWTDKMRPLFGLRLSFTRYCLYDTRLAVESGLVTRRNEELRLYRILDVRVRQTIFQQMFAVGTVSLYTTDTSHPTLRLRDVKDPETVARLISDRAEEDRFAKGITALDCFDAYRG